MVTALRWVLVPIACIVAWWIALFLGLVLLGIAEAFCPANEMVSDMCVAPWYRTVESGVFCLSTAMSAVFVVSAAFFVAPAAKAPTAWLAFSMGSVVALLFAWGTLGRGMFASAVSAGFLTAFFLSKVQKRNEGKARIVGDEIA